VRSEERRAVLYEEIGRGETIECPVFLPALQNLFPLPPLSQPLLKLASENPDTLLLVEAAGPDLLPLLPTIVDTAPALLPILGAAISIPPTIIASGAVVGPAAAYAVVSALPDDSVASVAIQTLAVALLGLTVPVVSLIGAKIIGDITK